MTYKSPKTRPNTADEAQARVVSTRTPIILPTSPAIAPTHPPVMAGMAYSEIVMSLPHPSSQLEELLAAPVPQPVGKYANSRDPAHAGDPLVRIFQRERRFYDLAYPGLLHFPLTFKDAELFRLASGFGQRPDDPRVWTTAAHPITRAAFIFAFHETIQEWAWQTERPCYVVTIISEKWHTSRRKRRIDPDAMTAAVLNALDQIGFEGLLSWEVQGIKSQDKGLYPHFHGIISPKAKGALSEEQARQRLSELFPDVDGADGVDMKPCQDSDDIVHFLMYAIKSPDKVKRIYKGNVSGRWPPLST